MFRFRSRPARLATAALALMGMLLLGGGTAEAVSGGSPGRHSKISKVYLTVTPDTAKTVPGGQTPLRPPSKSGATAVRSNASIPTPTSYITPDECLAHMSSRSSDGWAKGRFDSCQAYHLHAWHVVCDWFFCDQVGTADADLVDVAYTDDGDRQISVLQYISGWVVDGDMSEIVLTASVGCTGDSGSGPCNTLLGVPDTRPILDWETVGANSSYFVFEQPDGSGTGDDLLSRAHLNWHLTVTGGENGPVSKDGSDSHIRCDAAGYIIATGAGRGCVFPWAPVQTFTVYRSSTPESAQNIWEAQYSPLLTQPPSTFFGIPIKAIGGAPGVAPLHRTRDASLIAAHRNTARTACRTYFPGQYPGPDTDCDEYPFATTVEGAVDYDTFRNYVVKPINSDDNQEAGRQLGRFYGAQRILGSSGVNDPFYVDVQP